MTDPADALGDGAPFQTGAGGDAAVPIQTGPDGALLWERIRDLWLTHRVATHHGLAKQGAYAWDSPRYVPLLVRGEDGTPKVLFARERPDRRDGA